MDSERKKEKAVMIEAYAKLIAAVAALITSITAFIKVGFEIIQAMM